MKKLFAYILIVTALTSLLTGCTSDEKADIKLIYSPSSSYVRNGTMYIDGWFYNLSDKYDIVGFKNMSIIVSDKNGNRLCTFALNDVFERNCFIGRNNGTQYNISCSTDTLKTNQHWNLRFALEGDYEYAECKGASCTLCNNSRRSSAASGSSDRSPSSNTTADSIRCTECRGTGVCQECNGTRKNRYSGVMGAMGCVLCDKTGKCYKCNGTGKIHY